MYQSAAELIALCSKENKGTASVVIESESKASGKSESEILSKLSDLYDVMHHACHKTLGQELTSVSGLTGGAAKKLYEYQKQKKSICGSSFLTGVAFALSCFEVNTSMGKVVAAPTAGSCGILPAVTLLVQDRFGLPKETALRGLAAASGIGQLIEANATVSGAEGGCQAECGAAAAMAAGGAVEMLGGSPEQVFAAAAMAIKNVLGLVCDPIAGLVEIPCAKRNASGVSNALLCADLALAGISSFIPFDEVVETMYRVGRALPYELRETAMGGLAATPTGKRVKKELGM